MSTEKEIKQKFADKTWFHLLPSIDDEVDEKNLELFFSTMFERQEIWHKRFILKEEQPWTKDKIFANNKFTNVYRELDRNSQWLVNNVLKVETSRIEMIWKILLFRIHNCVEFMEFIKDQPNSFNGSLPTYQEYNHHEWFALIEAFRYSGGNPFTNAYLINSQACPGCTRDQCYGNKVVPALHKSVPILTKIFLKSKEPEEIIDYLNSLPAVASFISHEFYQDFTYIERYSGKKIFKFDQNDYTNVGPGAEIGIRLIFPSLFKQKKVKSGIYLLKDLAEQYLAKSGNFKYLKYDRDKGKYFVDDEFNITLHQIEMYLCEFQKYWKMQVGLGKQRSKFNPQTKTL